MPDLDLDDAFDTLTRELSAQTSSPGAAAAIRQSRRRRAAIGASAAVVVLALGGALVSQTVGEDQVLPAGPDTTLPDPAPLDATALDAATSGWVSGWRPPTEADSSALAGFDQEIACLGAMDEGGSLPEPARSGGGLLVTDGQQIGFMVFADFAEQVEDTERMRSAVSAHLSRCAGDSGSVTTYDDRGVATHYAVPADTGVPAQDVWITVLDDRLGILAIVNTQDPPTADVVVAVGRADLAALMSEATYSEQDGTEAGAGSASSSSGSSVVYDLVTAADLDPYFTAWPAWSTRGSGDFPKLPCLADGSGGAPSSTLSGTIGSTAWQSFETFESGTDADAAAGALLDALEACDQVRWDIGRLDLTGATQASIASYEQGALWVVTSGKGVSTLGVVQAGPPSVGTATSVGRLVLDSLATGRAADPAPESPESSE